MRFYSFIIFLLVFVTPAISVEVEHSGYLRTRGKAVYEKDLRSLTYLESRFRYEPELKINDNISIFVQADAEGLWGEGSDLLTIDSDIRSFDFKLKRAYLKYLTPVGLLEIGRMPSDWGMGIFTNDGNGFDDLFGDNYDGDTFDRVLFGTKPLGRESPLTTALIYDVVSTGVTINTDDDVSELILAVLYNDVWGIAGAYGGYRSQPSTSTEAFFGDIYFKLDIGKLSFKTEGVYLRGHSRAIQTSLNQGKYLIDQAGAAGSVSFTAGFVSPGIEAGFASGDNNPFNRHMTQFTFHQDYNVGLILYEIVLAELTERMYQNFYTLGDLPPPGADKLSTKGGVTNSWYIYPWLKFHIIEKLECTLGGLYARSIFPFKDAVEFIKTNTEKNLLGGSPSKELGWEVDAGIEWEILKNFKLGLQGGYFLPGDAFRDEDGKKHNVYTLQSRFTWLY